VLPHVLQRQHHWPLISQLLLPLLLHLCTSAGTLPDAWSAFPSDLYVGVALNDNITGTIPASYATNTGSYFDLYGTYIRGCVPKGLTGSFQTYRVLPNGQSVLRNLTSCG
jgi:hypothetical protein